MSLLLLKELIIIFLFVVTAAGVVPCGIPKKRPRTSSIVQFIFSFWSFEQKYSEKSENIIGLDSYILNSFSFFWLSLPVHSGSLKRIDYPKQRTLFLLNVSTALKGTHNHIFISIEIQKDYG